MPKGASSKSSADDLGVPSSVVDVITEKGQIGACQNADKWCFGTEKSAPGPIYTGPDYDYYDYISDEATI